MTVFRVHTVSNHYDIPADTPAEAIKQLKQTNPKVVVKKVKVLKA